MKKLILLSLLLFAPSLAHAVVKVGASLPDLGSIAAAVGGNKVEVFAIARGNANPHFVEVLPSYMMKVARCNLYLKAGLGLDQWADQIIDGSRNNRLTVVDCSANINVRGVPAGRVDASLGDVHPQGNPHYWLDPDNGVVIAATVRDALTKADPDNAAYYASQYQAFAQEARQRIAAWKSRMVPQAGTKIITYHSSWLYFSAAFGLDIAGMVEPLPGIPPTAKHLSRLVGIIKKEHASFLLQEPYFSDDGPAFLARESGIRVLKLAPSCSGVGPGAYFAHFDDIVERMARQEERP